MIFKPIFNVWILLGVGVVCVALVALLTFKSTKERRTRWLARGGMVLLLLAMAFRPSVAGGVSQLGVTNYDVVFAIDTTSSMVAEDYDGTNPRLDGVRKDVADLSKELAGARFSIVSFNSASTLVLPYTTDTEAVNSAMGTVTPEITYYSKGSTIDQPLDLLKSHIAQNVKSKPGRVQVLFYFGDGEQTASNKPKSLSPLKSLVQGGAVMGYGTDQGGKMKENTGFDSDQKPEYIKDYSNKDSFETVEAVSKIDEGNLRTIAKDIGISYEHRTAPSGVGSITKSLQSQNLERSVKNGNTATDIYWILAVGLGILLLIELRRIIQMLSDIKAGA
mgnify:CR=1 FL=1